jgi:hypothetical protein
MLCKNPKISAASFWKGAEASQGKGAKGHVPYN